MMDVSRHKPMDTLRGYVRDAELSKDHAGTTLVTQFSQLRRILLENGNPPACGILQ
jgi:hypothetical protein